MRVKIIVQGDAPAYATDIIRQVEMAFENVLGASFKGAYTTKSDFIDRMTDDEVVTFATMLEAVTERDRQKWFATSALYHMAPDFAPFREQVEDSFGKERADVLLARSFS